MVALVTLGLAMARAAPQTEVLAIWPSTATIPERLLRISILFAQPRGAAIDQIFLLDGGGEPIADAFVDQELWSPDGRILTLLIDPGRVKTGLIAHDEKGPVLTAHSRVSLRVGPKIIREWKVAQGGCRIPNVADWRIKTPRASTREPFEVFFPGPVDAQSRELIALVGENGRRIDGRATLDEGEEHWSFTPALLWLPGKAELVVHPRFESPCGDEIGEGFEHAAASTLASKRETASRKFVIH